MGLFLLKRPLGNKIEITIFSILQICVYLVVVATKAAVSFFAQQKL